MNTVTALARYADDTLNDEQFTEVVDGFEQRHGTEVGMTPESEQELTEIMYYFWQRLDNLTK